MFRRERSPEVSGNGCGLKKGGAIVCWSNAAGNHRAPFTQMSAGNDFACGLLGLAAPSPAGATTGYNDEVTAPKGRFTAVSAGLNCACGLRADGGVQCWGASLDVKYPGGMLLGA